MEKNFYHGSAALIFTPKGNTSASQILDKSVHAVFNYDYIGFSCVNNSGDYYYARHDHTPWAQDGITENTASVEVSGNNVILTLNGQTFTDAIPVGDYSILDFNGRYAIFEWFCMTIRELTSLPQFTYIKLEGDNGVIIEDHFDRPNGTLTVTPNGTPYSLFQ